MGTPARFTIWMKTILGAPFISRSLRNEWKSKNLPRPTKPADFCVKSAQALILAVAVCFSLGASDSSARYHDLNHRMMCTCGCAQLLGECNHVGCTESGQELSELSSDIASGMSDKQVFAAFTA